MATLTMTVSRLYGKHTALSLKEWFERDAMAEGDSYISLSRAGFFRRWQLTYHIAQDVLTQEHYSWLLSHMTFLASAQFTTPNIGLIGLTEGNFTMTMRK